MKFKSLFLSAGLFFTTTGYSVAGDADSVRTAQTAQTVAHQDTIWDYAYPVLDNPVVLLDLDGNITAFRCSGLVYDKSVGARGNGWLNSESLYIFGNERMWESSFEDLRRRLGIRDERVLQKLVIETIAYHYFVNKAKDKPHERLGHDKYIKKFNDRLRSRGFRLNRNGRIYNHTMYIQRQRTR